jgi:hypothetical protein
LRPAIHGGQRLRQAAGSKNVQGKGSGQAMRRFILLVFMLLLLLLFVGLAYTLIADPKPVVTPVEKVIPNDRFSS